MVNNMNEKVEEIKKESIGMDICRSLFIGENEELNLIKSSNIPHINVEDKKHWKSWNTADGNHNLIGQIHSMNKDKVAFHLCFNPSQKVLTKSDLKAIIKGIEYVENFKQQKINANKK